MDDESGEWKGRIIAARGYPYVMSPAEVAARHRRLFQQGQEATMDKAIIYTLEYRAHENELVRDVARLVEALINRGRLTHDERCRFDNLDNRIADEMRAQIERGEFRDPGALILARLGAGIVHELLNDTAPTGGEGASGE